MDSTDLKQLELNREEFPRTWEVLDSGIQDGVTPGVVGGLWLKRYPNQIWLGACGSRRLIPSPQPMLPDTVFDLASLSKVFGTATLAAMLVDRGWLSWDTPVSSFFSDYPYKNIQIHHLLSHTAGLIWWEPLWQKIRDHFAPEPVYSVSISARQSLARKLILSSEPQSQPGEKAVYSDISFLLLGYVLEDLTQMPLDNAVQKFVWDPLGIRGAFFRRVKQPPDQSVLDYVAATEQCAWRGGVLQGQVHDDNCWAMGGYGGHTGAFGTARDVLHFARALMIGRALTDSTLKSVWTQVSCPPGCSRTLGWDTPSGEVSSAGRKFSPYSVGHLGFTGTSLWIDLEAELAVTLLTNRVHPSRENEKIRKFRPAFHEALRLDLDGIYAGDF
jgi:CubicO group peptidase (beta-lactamase class C family)